MIEEPPATKVDKSTESPSAKTSAKTKRVKVDAAANVKPSRRSDVSVEPLKPSSQNAVMAQKEHRQDYEKDLSKGWLLSRSMGGRYLSKDPKFSIDGQYLVTGKAHQLQVLSTEDSLIYATIPAGESTVRAFVPSRISPERIYVGLTGPDRIEVWDLEDTKGPLNSEPVSGQVMQVAVGRSTQEDEEALYVLTSTDAGSIISRSGKQIIKTKTTMTDLCVSGSALVAIGPTTLAVGLVKDGDTSPGLTEWTISSEITAFAVRKHVPIANHKKKAIGSETRLSVALGTATGEVFVYENLLVPETKSANPLPAPRILHWHRDAVGSVKWSRDGNYLISGGKETVLLIWQLATGKKQFLPHLGAEIEHITVSPSGTSYALQLADNSVVAISTSELKPIAHFADLQAQIPSTSPADGLTQLQLSQARSDRLRLTGLLHPLNRNQLHIVVPPSIDRSANASSFPARPFLQSFDIANGRQLHRQALTRNKVTDLNTGPEGKSIQEPDVHLMQLSSDGSVLATVESWQPPSSDYHFLGPDDRSHQEHTDSNRESYLKFWQWNESKRCWAMQSRISNPHPGGNPEDAGRVLGLIAHGSVPRFFSLGDDLVIRSWTPRKPVRASNDKAPQEWSSRSQASLPSSDLTTTSSEQVTGSLAISPDSSLLACSIVPSQASTSTIHLLSTHGLQPIATLPPVSGQVHSLSFTSRTLYVLTTEVLTVYDIPSLRPVSSHPVPQPRPHIPLSLRPRSLALSSDLAAIAIPASLSSAPTSPHTQLEVLDLSRAKRSKQIRYRTTLPGIVTGIFPDPNLRAAFLVVMGDSSIFRLAGPRVKGSAAPAALPQIAENDNKKKNQEVQNAPALPEREVEDVQMQIGGDRRVVRPEHLARLFEGGVAGGMPVRAMFEGVMELFVPKATAYVSS